MPIIGRRAIFRQPSCNKPLQHPTPEKKKRIIRRRPKPKKVTLKQKLEQIKGIGKKIASEIVEEHKNTKSLISAIKRGKFSVGGIAKSKIKLILKKLKK